MVDTLLEELIPNYQDLFNYVFINKFHFNDSGLLTGVTPTPYDFEHKLDGIKYTCKKEKIDPVQAVFVGEGRNDEDVFRAMLISGTGYSIAYPSNESSIEHTASAVIRINDLCKVVEAIPLE